MHAKQRFGPLQGSKWGEMEVHLRFCLNTKPMALMRATCHAWAAALPPSGPTRRRPRSSLSSPTAARCGDRPLSAAAATSNGSVASKGLRAGDAGAVRSAPLQPQLNDEQMGAVGITAHAHGALPYVVRAARTGRRYDD